MEKRGTNLTLPTWLTAENHDNIKTDPHRNYIQINIRGVIRLLNFLTIPTFLTPPKNPLGYAYYL